MNISKVQENKTKQRSQMNVIIVIKAISKYLGYCIHVWIEKTIT